MNVTDPTFLAGPCVRCERDVLAARELDDLGKLVAVCLHCDAVLNSETLSEVAAGELEALGYFVEGESSNPHGSRGCRDGHCGVRQPSGTPSTDG